MTSDSGAGRREWPVWGAVAVATLPGVFVLPFAFPPTVPTFSSTWTLGFNNRVASVVAVLLSLCVLAWQIGQRADADDGEEVSGKPLPSWTMALGCLAVAAFSLWLGRYWIRSGTVFDDGSYILNQLLRALRDHATLYRDVEWPYGPLLFYVPLEAARLAAHLSMGAWWSYVLTLALMQAVGVAVLGYVLNRLPLSRAMRGVGLLLMTLGTLLPILGINYTLLRFLLPHALLLAVQRLRDRRLQATGFALAGALAMSVSPELGVALLAGVTGYALYRAWNERRWGWLGMIAAPVAGLAGFSLSMSRDDFAVMRSFASGGFNLIAQPEPHVLAMLTAAIALAPVAVGSAVRGRRPEAATLCGLYLCSLAMLGSAFGRVDPLHTFFSGLGVYLLALVAVDRGLARSAPRMRLAAAAWVAVFAGVVAMQVRDKVVQNAEGLRTIFAPPDPQLTAMHSLERTLGGAKLSAPVSLPWNWREELAARGQLVPSYSFEMRGTWDAAGVARKLDEMRSAEFTLIPLRRYVWEYELPAENGRARLLRLGFAYRRREVAFVPGMYVARELAERWKPLAEVGAFTLYQRVPGR